MANYGFKDKQVAIKLRDSVNAGAGVGSTNSMSGGGEDDFVNFKNLTGQTIPAYGLVFASGDQSISGIPAIGVVTFSAASDEDRRHPVFNGPDPVGNNEYGSGVNTNAYLKCLSDSPSAVVAGDRYYASESDDFKLTKTKSSTSPVWSAVTGFSPDDVGSPSSSNPMLVKAVVKDGIFPVDLTQVGGTQGSEIDRASWTYDVFDAMERGTGPTALETAVDPTDHNWIRHLGQMSAATFGLAYYNVDGDLELTWVNEILIAAECPPDE